MQTIRSFFLAIRGFANRSLNVRKNLYGPVGLLHTSYLVAKRGMLALAFFFAIINVSLAIVNMLPIPITDGGRSVFYVVERIRGKAVNDKIMVVAEYAGLVFILGIFVFVTYADIVRLVTGG